MYSPSSCIVAFRWVVGGRWKYYPTYTYNPSPLSTMKVKRSHWQHWNHHKQAIHISQALVLMQLPKKQIPTKAYSNKCTITLVTTIYFLVWMYVVFSLSLYFVLFFYIFFNLFSGLPPLSSYLQLLRHLPAFPNFIMYYTLKCIWSWPCICYDYYNLHPHWNW